jgi:hypothetical protein
VKTQSFPLKEEDFETATVQLHVIVIELYAIASQDNEDNDDNDKILHDGLITLYGHLVTIVPSKLPLHTAVTFCSGQ